MSRDDNIEMRILAFDDFIYDAKDDFSKEMKDSLSWYINKWKSTLRLQDRLDKGEKADVMTFVYPSGATYGIADFKKGTSRIISGSGASLLERTFNLELKRLSQEDFDEMKVKLKEIKEKLKTT